MIDEAYDGEEQVAELADKVEHLALATMVLTVDGDGDAQEYRKHDGWDHHAVGHGVEFYL